ncbi:L,D-transpeptidase [Rhodopseudomonas palustris]|uniref:L,D-transpeptidase n=1 Tax=Rhodopseudomonas palustris TaxID=1076 RepID=UPI002ACEC5CC|nr:L,D-transpeptidase [Rhodopseudomonas palustris]WQH02137.1 L,D-transpeptidase [Rhodopseudomonas palustris]
MITSGNALRSNSVTRPLVAFAAALLITVSLSGAASAQMLGYAAAPQAGPFGVDDEVLAAPLATSPDAALSDDEDAQLSDRLRRQVVAYDSNQPAGTIVIDTANTYLYYVLGGGRAIRYGVGVGREGFTWAGTQTITRKAEWPDWHPPAQMIARQPYLPRFMAGGPGNPLGARAMYLGSTEYRIHGTNDPSTIGRFVSSGCIRLTNEDVADLFSRTRVGARVVVLPKSSPNREARKARPGRHAMNIAVTSLD